MDQVYEVGISDSITLTITDDSLLSPGSLSRLSSWNLYWFLVIFCFTARNSVFSISSAIALGYGTRIGCILSCLKHTKCSGLLIPLPSELVAKRLINKSLYFTPFDSVRKSIKITLPCSVFVADAARMARMNPLGVFQTQSHSPYSVWREGQERSSSWHMPKFYVLHNCEAKLARLIWMHSTTIVWVCLHSSGSVFPTIIKFGYSLTELIPQWD